MVIRIKILKWLVVFAIAAAILFLLNWQAALAFIILLLLIKILNVKNKSYHRDEAGENSKIKHRSKKKMKRK